MANGSKEDIDLFIEHNENCEIQGLLEWIIELLPQRDFDMHVQNIKHDMEENEG